MVIKELKKEINKLLSTHDTYLLISGMLNLSLTEYLINSEQNVDDDKSNLIFQKAQEIKNGYPLQYAVGYTEFMSLKFYVNQNVLIPRPDTETLVEVIMERCNRESSAELLDIGTGSGAVGISLAHYINCFATLYDISKQALDIAKKNADENNVNVKFIQGDILSEIPSGKFDIIVSNPPYIETDVIPTLDKNVALYEPHLALDGGDDGLIFYRRISGIAPKILKSGGLLAFEVGHTQAVAVSDIMGKDFEQIEIIKDLCGISRVVVGRIK